MTHASGGRPFDATALARDLSLDPHTPVAGECRMRCPEGCDDGRRKEDYGTSLHYAADARCGLWRCNRCGNGGQLARLANGEWSPLEAPAEAWEPEDRSEAIDAAQAWTELQALKFKHLGAIRAWAQGRGWGEDIAQSLCESPDVAWAGPHPISGAPAAERLRDHAVYAKRPLLVAIRDEKGQVVSAMRRAPSGAPPADGGPKAKATARKLCPVQGASIFGDLPAAVEAAKQGLVLLIVEGEPDFLAAQAMLRLRRMPGFGAVLGSPAAGGLRLLGEALAAAFTQTTTIRPRIVLVPHLADDGPTDAAKRKGERAMESLAFKLRGVSALVSTCHLRPLRDGKVDLAQVLEGEGVDAVARQLGEVQPRLVTDGNVTSWVWDDTMRFEGAEVAHTLARRCWPVAMTRRVEGGEHGLRYRFVTEYGAVGYGILSASAWADKNAAQSAGRAAAEAGVEILAGHGADWAMALGQWAGRERARKERVAVVSRPGWHRDGERSVYVNGAHVHGAAWIYDGAEARSMRAGTLEDWRRGVAELGNTSGLLLALGCALAGALVEPLSLPLFMLHLAGRSSSGKTSAGRLAAAVWSSPREILTYNGTGKGLTLAIETFNGACVVLDEIKEISPQDLGKVIHTITDGRSRTMAQQTGDKIRDVRRWALTAVSTGEITVAEALGTQAQGGQAVRAIDLRVELGEVTRDAAHAVALARWLERCYGVAGDAWVGLLRDWEDTRWMELMREVDNLADTITAQDDPELGRMVRALALCCQALVEARSLLGLDLDRTYAEQLLHWAVERVRVERGAVTSPETRALRSLCELIESSPALFPDEKVYREGQSRQVVGVWLLDGEDSNSPVPRPTLSGALAVSEGTLKSAGVLAAAGVGPRAFLNWCAAQGLSDGGAWRRVGGKAGRWHRLDLAACNTSEAS